MSPDDYIDIGDTVRIGSGENMQHVRELGFAKQNPGKPSDIGTLHGPTISQIMTQ